MWLSYQCLTSDIVHFCRKHISFPSCSFLYHTEFKRPHAERVGEAQCGIHGDRYSCVTTAAGRRQRRIFLCHFTCIVTTVIPTRPIEWDGFLASGLLRLFFPLVSLTLSPPASPRVTLSLHLSVLLWWPALFVLTITESLVLLLIPTSRTVSHPHCPQCSLIRTATVYVLHIA